MKSTTIINTCRTILAVYAIIFGAIIITNSNAYTNLLIILFGGAGFITLAVVLGDFLKKHNIKESLFPNI